MIETAYQDLLNKPYLDFVRDDNTLKVIRDLPYQATIQITSEYRNRMDLISFDAYSTTELWWLIAIYNNVVDPFDFNDDKLYIPSYNEFQNLMINNLIARNTL